MPPSTEHPTAPTAGAASTLADTQPGRVSDLELARHIAPAVRSVQGVADLTAGRAMAVTYGPGERIVGVAVSHSPAGEVTIEAHVVVMGSHLSRAATLPRLAAASHDAEHTLPPQAVLLALADDVRAAVRQAVSGLAPATEMTINVFFDDMQ